MALDNKRKLITVSLKKEEVAEPSPGRKKYYMRGKQAKTEVAAGQKVGKSKSYFANMRYSTPEKVERILKIGDGDIELGFKRFNIYTNKLRAEIYRYVGHLLKNRTCGSKSRELFGTPDRLRNLYILSERTITRLKLSTIEAMELVLEDAGIKIKMEK